MLVLVILSSTVSASTIAALVQNHGAEGGSSLNNSFINRVDNIISDFGQYIDSSVMFRLPDGIGDDEEISVIVTVSGDSVLGAYCAGDRTMSIEDYVANADVASIEAEVASQKASYLASLDSANISYETGEDYSTVLKGFEIIIKAGDFEKACKALGDGMDVIVGEEYEKCETELVENAVNVHLDTGIFDTANAGYDGSGIVVAVLDTGLDYNHTAFSPDNFSSSHLGLTYDEVASVIADTAANRLNSGLTVDDVYINEKVPYGYDYADNDSDVYSTHNNHGTHVSGVILGKDDVITGVAPNAQLVSMKIFSDVVDTARTAWILSALEDCVVLGVDVINMSIGTACGFSRESDEESVGGIYDMIREAGINMIVAASNSFSSSYGSEKNGNLGLTSNPDTGTVGSPSTYEGVMSVASIAGDETPYLLYGDKIVYFTESVNGAAEENKFCDILLGDNDSITIEYVLIPGVGRSADYTGLDVSGKIALVRRGSNTFEEKAIIAQEQGAAGIIIYNNVSGDIKMNVADATLAACSISQDDGEMLAQSGTGTITVARSQTSGPFISDFSSWGPTADLKIKPEITAHGGNILSAVTGGSYDRLSGTSMACPNLAGVVVLLRQYVVENFPEIANDNDAIGAMVYSLLMSTADIAYGKNGLPYAVRKQGAGLANLMSSINTPAYITTFNADGSVMDKTKIELGDDPSKTGVYEMKFSLNNFGEGSVSYDLGAYVMTEGVSDTKTNAGLTTVTEESYLLDGAKIEILSVDGGSVKKNTVSVEAGQSAVVTVMITLSDSDKEYLNSSFENGMYVEGFITLTAKSGTDVSLNVPYLAFYGDWTVAPLFDLTYYDTNADELDDGIDVEDKTMADAYATRPVGGVSEDYVSYLGSYYFLQDPEDIKIAASPEHVALSNQEGTLHSLRFVWAGMLRNASSIDITITDSTTGELIFETTEEMIRKSYSDGGSYIYPANIELEFDTIDYNLPNNTEYTVKLVGHLDYGDGGITTNSNNVVEFPFTVDFEAPTVTGVEYYYKYDKTANKNRLYADVLIYDNHYAMSSQVGYIALTADENGNDAYEMIAFEQYLTPVYSEHNSTTRVTFELTDYIYDIKNNAVNDNCFSIVVYDYALNTATYEIGLPTDYSEFFFEELEDGLTLSPNEVYTLDPVVKPYTEWAELLTYASSKPSVARIVNNKIIAVAPGNAIIKAQDPATGDSVTFGVTVLGEDDEGYVRYGKPVADVFTLDGFYTVKSYYMVESEDKKIGDIGSTNFFEGRYALEMYPSESVTLNYSLDPYFPGDTTVEFETSNENIVKIDAYGNVTAVAEGFASVTVKVMMDGQSTYYSETVTVEVNDPYVTNGAMLTHYYGNGGLVVIPDRLSLTEIGQFAFSNFEYIAKTAEELEFDSSETSKAWFIGDNTITKVIIPEGVEKIDSYAFANLTALEEVVLPSTLEAIDYGAFYNCVSLKKITFSGENNLKIINQNAFELCNLEGTLDLSAACVVSDYAFAGNKNLKNITLPKTLISVGGYAFAGCESLEKVTVEASKVKYGIYAFTGCESLTEFTVNSAVIPEGMFYECESLAKVTIGADVRDIGPFAFRDTKVAEYTVSGGNTAYKVQTADRVVSTDGKTVYAVSPLISGEFSDSAITVVGRGAFSHNQKITSVVLGNVTVVQDYGFASSKYLESVSFGKLTYIGEYAFFETAISVLPEFGADTKVGKYAFSFTYLTEVTVPDGAVVEEGTYSECVKLETVVIGDDVVLGDYAFSMNKDLAYVVESYMEGDRKLFKYVYRSALTSLTIGKNAVIGEAAFNNHGSLTSVTLGEGAEIGRMAFYSNASLTDIDLSEAVSIGDYAFSGDVYYVCNDSGMTEAAYYTEGEYTYYMYTYIAPQLVSVDLSSSASIGEYAFAYCRVLESAVLGSEITEIPQYAFAGCDALCSINLGNITSIGEYAFMECGFTEVDLSSVATVSGYAFVSNRKLEQVTLSAEGSDIGEGAFSYCDPLASVKNLEYSEEIGDYAFAYDAITEADLSGAVNLGAQVFLKEEVTPFKVTLSDKLVSIGDNPFAMCIVEPFSTVAIEEINGHEQEFTSYTFDISDTVKVIDGSLYCKTVNGLELVTYAGNDPLNAVVADGTVRITAYAFAGSDVARVKLPYHTTAIGHKAFYECDDLEIVMFGSYTVPIFEEEFDSVYYETLEHIPGIGNYASYEDEEGNQVELDGMGLIPYYMWNATGGQYSNVFYGATFKDYVGYVTEKIIMVRPVNGVGYDSFVCAQYFDYTIDGPAAPDDITVAAIKAIDAIPEKVSYEHKALVEAARAAYDKIATYEQKALVTNYSKLVSAEQRIAALAPVVEEEPVEEENDGALVYVIVVLAVGGLIALAFILYERSVRPKNKNADDAPAEEACEEAVAESIEEANENNENNVD